MHRTHIIGTYMAKYLKHIWVYYFKEFLSDFFERRYEQLLNLKSKTASVLVKNTTLVPDILSLNRRSTM